MTTDAVPPITFRIPGAWADPGELIGRLPEGFRLTPEELIMPDGTRIEFVPMQPDADFARIFQTACRQPASDEELATLSRYSVIVGLSGPGGSRAAVATMMQAGAAIVQAGGAGVFIDNSALAHGGSDWLAMTDDGGSDAMSFAFVGVIQGREEIYTMGMQTMGLPDLVMRRGEDDASGEAMIEIMRYVCAGERPVDVGHVFTDEYSPRFQVVGSVADDSDPQSPMYNPRGRLRIASFKDVAEGN